MIKLNCLLLCFACFAVGSFSSVVPFIDPCEEQDTACLLKSSQKAIPFFADGGFLGLNPLDPLKINKEVSSNEGGLKISFKDVTVIGAKNCKVTSVELSTKDKFLKFSSNCPIHVKGTYSASGKLLDVPIDGSGPFTVDAEEIHLAIKVVLNIVTGKDGIEHWQVSKPEHTYAVEKTSKITFENLFNGDQEKAGAVNKILAQHPKELIESFGKPIVNAVIDSVLENFGSVIDQVPRSDLQKI